MKIAPPFEKHIAYLDLDSIAKSLDVVYIVDSNLVLQAFNEMWCNFARNNGGEEVLSRYPLGSNVADAFREPIKSFLIKEYQKALEKNIPFEQTYECPSAHEFRLYRQTAYPLIHAHGLVITNHLVCSSDHRDEPVEFNRQFVDASGSITQCQNCRKIRNPREKESWLWVPSLVENRLANISHGICPRCLDHYFPDIDEEG